MALLASQSILLVFLGSKACVQDIDVHREKAREGVPTVEIYQSPPFVASAKANGIIKFRSRCRSRLRESTSSCPRGFNLILISVLVDTGFP